jgi:LPS export ABC transporter protein LptC
VVNVIIVAVFSVFTFFGCSSGEDFDEETSPYEYERQKVEKFSIKQTRKGKINMKVEGESAVINGKEVANIHRPVMKFYEEGDYGSTLTAESAEVNMETYDIRCVGKCTVQSAKNERLETTDLMYNAENKLIYSYSPIVFEKPGETVRGSSFQSDAKLNNVIIKNQRIVLD